ncbi:MAG: DUF4878 domain-containing protein [Spirochaetaceae bacterium]|jgi:hypothetical protein|nr:DUF4878 domain-containing protein [Spirochaetaceae bacterium]
MKAEVKRALFLVGFTGFVLAAGLLIGCNKGESSPSDVTRQLYMALEKGDAKTIGELMTPEAAQTMAVFSEKMKGVVAAKGGITSAEETIDGDTAMVRTTFKDGSTEVLNLVKIDGKWKVTINK